MARLIFLLMIAFLPGHGVSAGAKPPHPQGVSPPGSRHFAATAARQGDSDPLRAEAQTEPHKIGRLFFSPGERAMLDRMRQKSIGSTVGATEQITLNGIVRRSSGKTTAWINQLPQDENETSRGVAVQGQAAKASALLLLPSGKQVRLKPGQTFDTAKGRIREGYENSTAPAPQGAAR